MEVDYSQEELRVLASLSQDKEMIRCFTERIDIHIRTAAEILGIDIDDVDEDGRQKAKPVNFGKVYGQKEHGLVAFARDEYGVDMTLEEAVEFDKRYFRLYSGVRLYQKRLVRQVRREGCVWVEWQGKPFHRRNLYNITSKVPGLRNGDERKAKNTKVQGGASLYTLFALLIIYVAKKRRLIPGLIEIVGTVHDSIWFEVWEDCVEECFDVIGRIMVGLPLAHVPSEVEAKYGPSLGEMEVLGMVNSLDIQEGQKFDYNGWTTEKVIGFI